MSYVGSAIATLTAYGTMMVLSYIIGQRYYAVPYDMKRIVGYLLLSVVFSSVAFYVFGGNLIIGSLLLLVFLILIYFSERKEVLQILRK